MLRLDAWSSSEVWMVTLTASRSSVQQGQSVTTLPLGSSRLPITLPQPGFTVRAWPSPRGSPNIFGLQLQICFHGILCLTAVAVYN
jgi:hypothetical protein